MMLPDTLYLCFILHPPQLKPRKVLAQNGTVETVQSCIFKCSLVRLAVLSVCLNVSLF